jgi:hypothetical protein
MDQTPLDVRRLMQLRLAVGRFGEMDRAKWWNTKGLLGGLGEMALSRGFPKSHPLARARAVFSVAAARCREVFDPPQGITLWNLPPEVEDQFQNAWAEWLDDLEPWADFIDRVDAHQHSDLLEALVALAVLDVKIVEQAKKLKRAPDGRSVVLPGDGEFSDETIALLAAGFHRSEPAKLAVPYVRTGESR